MHLTAFHLHLFQEDHLSDQDKEKVSCLMIIPVPVREDKFYHDNSRTHFQLAQNWSPYRKLLTVHRQMWTDLPLRLEADL